MAEQAKNSETVTTNVILTKTGEINISNWITNGWDLVIKDFGSFLLLSFIYLTVMTVASSTGIVGIVLFGPLTAGFFYIIFNRIRGKDIYIGDIAKGFEVFVPSLLAGILISIFVGLGYFFLIIPGIIISALYMFALPLIMEKKMEFWEAMETSRKLVTKNWFELSIFMLVLSIFQFIGFLLLLIGLLVAVPVMFAAIAYAYCDLIGLEEPTDEKKK